MIFFSRVQKIGKSYTEPELNQEELWIRSMFWFLELNTIYFLEPIIEKGHWIGHWDILSNNDVYGIGFAAVLSI